VDPGTESWNSSGRKGVRGEKSSQGTPAGGHVNKKKKNPWVCLARSIQCGKRLKKEKRKKRGKKGGGGKQQSKKYEKNEGEDPKGQEKKQSQLGTKRDISPKGQRTQTSKKP